MKKIIILILLIACNKTIGQENFHLDMDSFLIGMFDDYNGRINIPSHSKKSTALTSFYCSQKNLSQLFIDSLMTYKKDLTIDIKLEKGTIYSAKLANYFNKFYKSKLLKGVGYSDSTDISHPVYSLRLNKNLFKSENQKFSFLSGSFLRYGKLENGNTIITFANSSSHYETVVDFIEKLGFKVIKKSTNTDTIPAGQLIIFTPSEKYSSWFNYLAKMIPIESGCK